MTEHAEFRVFRGSETEQTSTDANMPRDPNAWYWEPLDWAGDTLWSGPFPSEEEAESVARSAMIDELPPWARRL